MFSRINIISKRQGCRIIQKKISQRKIFKGEGSGKRLKTMLWSVEYSENNVQDNENNLVEC